MVITPQYGKKETKFWATNPNFTSVGQSVTRFACTSTIAQGADIVSQRLGRKIRVKRLMFRGQLLGGQTNSVADDPFNTMRVTVVRCVPGSTFTSYTVNNALDRRFSTSAGLLEVIYDRTVVIPVFGKDSTGYIANAAEYEIDLHIDIPVEYGGTAAAVPITQEVVMYLTSDSAAVVNPGFSSASVLVLEYVDDS